MGRQERGEKEKEEDREQKQDDTKRKETMLSDGELDMDQEMTQSEMEIEDHELQEILDREHLDLEGFVETGDHGRGRLITSRRVQQSSVAVPMENSG